MKFPKQIRLNWITFLGLVALALVGVVFLGLIWTYYSDNQKAAHTESALHPHTHPHDESHSHTPREEPTDEQVGEEAQAVAENEAYAEELGEGKTDSRRLGTQRILAAFQPALKLRDKHPNLADAKMHDIAKELGEGDPEWTEFYHLKGHILFNTEDNKFYLTVADAVRYFELKEKFFGLSDEEKKTLKESRTRLQWNTDGEELGRQTEPIKEVRTWMKENAPAEWEVVNKRYLEMLKQRSAPKSPLVENWQTLQQRVDLRYETFFEALELLPDDSVTFQMFFESTRDDARESLLSEQEVIQGEPPRPPEPKTPTHTWDMVHVEKDEKDAPHPSGKENVAAFKVELPTDERLEILLRDQFSPERFNRSLETLRQYGREEGLRRIKARDPKVAAEIEKLFQNR